MLATSPAVAAEGEHRPALTAGPGRMADAAVAVDPEDPLHVAAAANPYGSRIHIEVAESTDGGRTWSPPVTLLPPGAAKSYDPTPLFLPGGRLVVAGGAAAAGRPFCQPGSRAFVASVAEGKAAYDVVRPPRAGVYVDRPTAVVVGGGNMLALSWTESSGPGAECRGLPVQASTIVRQWGEGATCSAPVAVPSSGSPASFGAGLASRAGDLTVAVRELGPASRSRLVVTESPDGGCSFSPPLVLDEGPQAPSRPAAVGGFAVGGASVTISPDRSTTIAWSVASPTGVATRLWQRAGTPGAAFSPLAAPPDAATTELLPTVVADRVNGLWLVTASLATPRRVSFLLRRWSGAWAPTLTLATAVAGRYEELGEALGLATTSGALYTAVPVDSAASSALVVDVQPVPEPPRPPPDPPSTSRATPPEGGQGATDPTQGRTPGGRPSMPIVIVGLAALAATVGGILFFRRRSTAAGRHLAVARVGDRPPPEA